METQIQTSNIKLIVRIYKGTVHPADTNDVCSTCKCRATTKGSVIFYLEGVLKIEGIRYFFLDQKGIRRFLKNLWAKVQQADVGVQPEISQ